MKISIPEPCHEDWNKMTPVDFQQRHCAACDRTLTDFTTMTDAEIGRRLRRNVGKICGRFRTRQLNSKLVTEGPRNFGGVRAIAATAGLLLSISVAGQEVDAPDMEILAGVSETSQNVKGKNLEIKSVDEKRRKTITITGQVSDSYGETLIGASILVHGYCTGTVTDIDGRFSIMVEAAREVKLIIAYTGFATTEYYISGERTKAALNNKRLTFELESAIVIEETAMGYIVADRSLIHRIFVAPVRRHVVRPVRKLSYSIREWRASRFDRREARQLRRAERRAALAETPIEAPTSLTTPEKVEPSSPVMAPGDIDFSASPNPFTDHLRVNFSLEERGSYRLELYAASGKLVGSWEGVGEAGPQERVVDQQLGNLPKGMYFLELRTKKGASVLTLVR
ncbi:MAG: carboxypeptidase-like regulatory domain-containing protein [Lewinella sp.]